MDTRSCYSTGGALITTSACPGGPCSHERRRRLNVVSITPEHLRELLHRKAMADSLKLGQICAVGPPCSLSWREGFESDRVAPDLDQRLGWASKPIAKR